MKSPLAILALIVTASAGLAQQPPRAPVPLTFFGMHIQSEVIGVAGKMPWPSVAFGGIRLWDTRTTWGDLEPSRGNYVWAHLDAYLRLAAKHNQQVLYTFGATPTWASSHPAAKCDYFPGGCYAPKNEQDWKDFVTALVKRNLSNYGGSIKAYECWNEANQPEYWSDSIKRLVTICQDMYAIVHRLQPAAVVLSPSGVGSPNGPADEVNAFFGNGGKGYADAVAFHGYPPCCNVPNPVPEDILKILHQLRTAMSRRGVSELPIWDTEASWGPSGQLPRDSVGYVARFQVLQWAHNVSRVYWYAWNDTSTGTLYCENCSPQTILPQGVAYQQVENWLFGNTMTKGCSANSRNIWTCGLENGGYRAEIVWSTAGSVRFTPASTYVDYLDLAGGTHRISGSQITIGSSPILLETARTARRTTSVCLRQPRFFRSNASPSFWQNREIESEVSQ